MEAVAPWCSVDTRTGRLAVVLEEYNCFDAEMYADELDVEEPIDFREDQRSMFTMFRISMSNLLTTIEVNLGKWILRHIFSKFIDEMIKKDEAYRKVLNENRAKIAQQPGAPLSIQIPASEMTSWQDLALSASQTPRANSNSMPAMTPGMGIGVATPAATIYLQGVPEDGGPLGKRVSQLSRGSADRSGDYFSNAPVSGASDTNGKSVATPGEIPDDKPPKSPTDADKETNGKESGLFGKKFRMGMPFGGKKLGRSLSANVEKPVIVDEKAEDSEDSDTKEKEVDDNLNGVIQTIHSEYEKLLLENLDQPIESLITPSLPNETPVLKPPPMTTVIIQEETSGGSADLYRGTVSTVGDDANQIAQVAPMWLGDLLLRVSIYHRMCPTIIPLTA